MKRWKKSGLLKGFLLVVLAVSVWMDVLAGMYLTAGREYAASPGKAAEDFFVAQEGTGYLLDGYIRLFEEYMQIGSLIAKDGNIDYDKKILVSLLDDKSYTVQELLKNSVSEGEAVEQFRNFMEDFEKNCREGKSYPWYTRFTLQMEEKIVLEEGNIFQFKSPNAVSLTKKQLKNMKQYQDNMVVVSLNKGDSEENGSETLNVALAGEIDSKIQFLAKSSYEGYIIKYFPDYAKYYYSKQLADSYQETGQEEFQKAYQNYCKDQGKQKTENEFYQMIIKSRDWYEEALPEDNIPWSVHVVPRSLKEAKEYVTFLVETYQEMKYFFSKSNFIFAYENSQNLLITNQEELWAKMKAEAASGKEVQPATDSDRMMYAYFNGRAYEGKSNFPEESFRMSGNVLEKLESIGANYSSASYSIGVGIDLQGVQSGQYEDEFVRQYQLSHQRLEMFWQGRALSIGFLFTILSFLLLAVMCGNEQREEKNVLKGYDRIWLELQILILCVIIKIICWLLALWNEAAVQVLIWIFGAIVWVLCCICLVILFSIIRKGKLHYGVRYSLLGMFVSEVFFHKMRLREWLVLMKRRIAMLPAKQKYLCLFSFELGVLCYLAGCMLYIKLSKTVTCSSFAASVPGAFLIALGISFLLVLFFWQRRTWKSEEADQLIIEGTQKIMEGDFSYQLPDMEAAGCRKVLLSDTVNGIGEALERAVEESVRSERMKTELIANVSHDIKTPLTSVINYVDLIKREDVQNEVVQKYIAVLERKSQRLKTLIEDLVEASKASSGVMELEISTLNFNELIRQTNGEFDDRFEECCLELVSNIPEESLFFQGDGRRVFRILENLYNNTAKYAMPHTRVYVSLEREENFIVFKMKNISAAKLNITPEELTERFVRGERSRTTEGSGLGLSIAKSLTELMEGSFAIELDGDLFCAVVSFPECEKNEG